MNGKYLPFEDLKVHFPEIVARGWDATFMATIYRNGLILGFNCPKAKTVRYSVASICRLLTFRP